MDFRAALKPRAGPKLGSEIKTNTPAKVDFRSVLGKKEGGSPKPTPAVPDNSGAPADFRAVLNKKKNPEPEKPSTKDPAPPPAISKDKQTNINGVNVDTDNKKNNLVENKETDKNKDTGTTKKESIPCTEKKSDVEVVEPENKSGSVDQKKSNDVDGSSDEKKIVVNSVDGEDGKKKSTGKAPVFTQPLSDLTVLDGERLRLECTVTSDPQAVITWTLDGKVVKPSKFIILSNEGMTQIIMTSFLILSLCLWIEL